LLKDAAKGRVALPAAREILGAMSWSFARQSLLAVSLAACGSAASPPASGSRARTHGQASAPLSSVPFRIVGYCQPQTASTFDLGHLTHVFYAFAIPHADGSVDVPGLPVVLHDLVYRAHAERVAVSLSVGGWMDGDDGAFHALASDPAARARFARELRDLVAVFELDGVDIDWEFPEAEVASDYTALLLAVHAALPQGALLTAAVGAHESSTGGVTRAVLPYLSFVAIMAYDAEGVHHAPLELARDALALWHEKGLPAHKLVLGVPLYSRPHYLPFWEIVQRDVRNADRDELRGETYNGRPTIVAKTELAMAQAGGIMAWELGQDARGEHSLMQTIASTVRSRRATLRSPAP
jgi:chitinase